MTDFKTLCRNKEKTCLPQDKLKTNQQISVTIHSLGAIAICTQRHPVAGVIVHLIVMQCLPVVNIRCCFGFSGLKKLTENKEWRSESYSPTTQQKLFGFLSQFPVCSPSHEGLISATHSQRVSLHHRKRDGVCFMLHRWNALANAQRGTAEAEEARRGGCKKALLRSSDISIFPANLQLVLRASVN